MFKELKNVIGFIEQRNAIALLLAFHHLPNPHWRTVENYCLNELDLVSFTWQTYNKLCKQLVKIGLATSIKLRTNAADYRLNEYGHQVATIVEEAMDRINLLSSVPRKK